MFRSSTAKWVIGLVILIAVLGLLRFKPWQRGNSEATREELAVGFLPVT
jgi:predicted negative regulator of RcsB-dependent stress response